MADQAHLKQIHQTWHVILELSASQRKLLNKARFKRSLKTSSLADANRRKHAYLNDWKRQILDAENGKTDPHAEVHRLALDFSAALEASPNIWKEDDHGREFNEHEEEMSRLKDAAKDILEEHGSETASRFFKAATGEATLIRDHYPTWLGQTTVTEHTRGQHEATIVRYLKWPDAATIIEETTRKKAGAYINHLLSGAGLSRQSVKRHVSTFSTLWRYLIARGLAEDNPWRGQELGRKKSTMTRKGLSDDAVLKLLSGSYSTARYRRVLADLLRLALLTGARLDELCALKCTDVSKEDDGYWLQITQGKTEAAERKVPLHLLGEAIIDRRLGDENEYLFAGLSAGGPDEKRSWYVSKAYGRFRQSVGVTERGQDFHALRNTFIGMMEGVGAPESTVKLIVGHRRESMTYGHYSKGDRVDLRAVVEMANYGPKITGLI